MTGKVIPAEEVSTEEAVCWLFVSGSELDKIFILFFLKFPQMRPNVDVQTWS